MAYPAGLSDKVIDLEGAPGLVLRRDQLGGFLRLLLPKATVPRLCFASKL